ncbi:MAG: GAF domain-containing protein [Nitrospirota bacterium]|nr:GAF domain-containing protein [Nitrospirota bacterium]
MKKKSLHARPAESLDLFEQKFSILQEILNYVVATDNITSIANLMLDLSISYTNAEKGSLMLLNEFGELYISAARGIDIQLFNSFREKIGEGIAGTVAKQRVCVLVGDIDKDEKFREKKRDRYKTKSFISCPILHKNRLLGVLNINDKKDGSPFTNDEFTLIKTIANQAAIVLHNAFLMNELKMKATDLEEINKKLIEFDVVKTEFLTRVSHELRTPLNSIKGSIYYLNETLRPLSDEHREFYRIISDETNKLISMAENLLDFLRLENETQSLKKSVISLTALVQEVANSKFLRTKLQQRGIELRLDAKKEISNVLVDKIRVFQFFTNIIEGLSDYLSPNDEITVSFDENEYVEIQIVIPKRLPDSIYRTIWNSTYFFRTEHADERFKLYLAWKVAETHKWKLLAENLEDSFTVSVSIPNSEKVKLEAVLATTIDMFTEFITELLDINICSIMLADELTGELSIRSARGLSDEVISRTRIRATDSISGWVALEGKPLLLENIDAAPQFVRLNTQQYNTNSLLSLPLKIDDKVVGVINLNNKKTGKPFTRQDLHIASSLGERISCFLKKLYAGEHSEDYFNHFIASFGSLLNAEKNYPKKNNLFPSVMNSVISNLGVRDEEKDTALYISLIYDLGLVFSENGFLKEKKLSPSELSALRVHPYSTIGLLDEFEFSEDVKKAILHHHEKFDGSGYPDRLKGEEIPFISRVLSVVDSYCAMITEKPYRKAFTKNAALAEIKKGSGSLYDPVVVEALEKAMHGVVLPDR